MTEVRSIRFPDDVMQAIRQRAKREQVDESTAIRQLVQAGLRQDACDLYREGRLTLREAAAAANLSLRDMIDLLQERGIRGNVTSEDQREALRHALGAMKRKR